MCILAYQSKLLLMSTASLADEGMDLYTTWNGLHRVRCQDLLMSVVWILTDSKSLGSIRHLEVRYYEYCRCKSDVCGRVLSEW